MPDACGAEAACTTDAATGAEAAADVPAEEAAAGAETVLPAGVSADWLLPEGWQAESKTAMAVRTGNLFMAAGLSVEREEWVDYNSGGWKVQAAFGVLQSFRSVQDLFNFIPQIPFPTPIRSLSPNANKSA
jgi:hypothetical protein